MCVDTEGCWTDVKLFQLEAFSVFLYLPLSVSVSIFPLCVYVCVRTHRHTHTYADRQMHTHTCRQTCTHTYKLCTLIFTFADDKHYHACVKPVENVSYLNTRD